MRADGVYPAVIHDDDLVRVLHRAYALRDDEHRGGAELLLQPFADRRVGRGVHGGGGVVQDHHLGMLQKRPRDAQPLLLSARDIDAALPQFRIIAVREGHDEIVRLRRACGVLDLLVRGVGVAPFQIIFYRAGEKHVLLQHHRDRVAESVQLVVSHVHAAHFDGAAPDVVKTGDELHQRALRRARAADDAHHFAGLHVKIDAFEVEDVARLGIREIDVVEVHAAVCDFERFGAGIVRDVGHFAEHFRNAPRGRAGKHQHHEHHRHHTERHQDLHDVVEKRRK